MWICDLSFNYDLLFSFKNEKYRNEVIASAKDVSSEGLRKEELYMPDLSAMLWGVEICQLAKPARFQRALQKNILAEPRQSLVQ